MYNVRRLKCILSKGIIKQMGIKDGETHSACKGAGEGESEAAGGNLMDAADHSDHEVSPVNTDAVLESAQGYLLIERISVLLKKDIVIDFGVHSLAQVRIMKASLNLLLVNC